MNFLDLLPADITVEEALKDTAMREKVLASGLHNYDQLLAEAVDQIKQMRVMDYIDLIEITAKRLKRGDQASFAAGLGYDTILSKIIEHLDEENEE